MIVDPDFVDHWKTRMLVGSLDGDEVAPLYVLRLWAHCQNRRQWEFDNVSTEALKALCHFSGQANKLESSLVASGFIRRDGRTLIISGWDEYNSSLIAAWNNGGKGGRPQKTTQKEPLGKPLGKPLGYPIRSDRIGSDENGSDENLNGRSIGPTDHVNSISDFDFDAPNEEVWAKVPELASRIVHSIWPNCSRENPLRPQDRSDVLKACFLSLAVLSENWLRDAEQGVVSIKPKNRGAYFRKCLFNGAEAMGHEFHKLMDRVQIPESLARPKSKESTENKKLLENIKPIPEDAQ